MVPLLAISLFDFGYVKLLRVVDLKFSGQLKHIFHHDLPQHGT